MSPAGFRATSEAWRPGISGVDLTVVAEAKVGIMFLIVILLAVGTGVYLTGRLGYLSGQQLNIHFANVEGLSEGAKVLLMGMEVGRVLEIRMATPQDLRAFPEKPIVVHVAIDRDVRLKTSDRFVITQSGLLGDTSIAVRRLSQEQLEAEAALSGKPLEKPLPLASGHHVAGVKAIGITELGDDAHILLAQVKSAIADFQKVYTSPEIREQLPLILANVERATANAMDFSEALARISLQNEGRIGEIATQIASAARELNLSAARVRQMIVQSAPNIERSTGRIAQMIEGSAGSVEATAKYMERTGGLVVASAEDIRKVTGRAAQLVDTSAADLEHTISSVRSASDLVLSTAENVDATTREARQSLGRMTTRVDQMVQSTAANIEKTAATVEETTRLSAEDFRRFLAKSSGNLEAAAEQVEKATREMAALVESSGADIGQSTKRIAALVEKSAADVETASTNLAGMSSRMHEDVAAMTARARAMMETSAADVEKTSSDIAATAGKVRADMEAITGRARTMVESSATNIEKTTGRIAELAEKSSADIELTTRRIHDLVAMSPIPGDLATASGHIRRSAANVEKVTNELVSALGDPEVDGSIRKVLSNLSRASDHILGVTQEAEALLRDGRRNVNDEQMWANVRQAIQRLNQSAEDLEAITEHGRKVLTDPAFTEDITATVSNARKLAERGAVVAEQAEETLTRIDDTVAGVKDISRKLSPSYSEAYGGLEAIEDFGLRADLVGDFYFGDKGDLFWRLGIRDLGDSETFILQRGMHTGFGGTFRAGLFANELGVGYDHQLSDRFRLELDAWDPDDPRLEARGLWRLSDCWDLTLGASEVFAGTEPFIGLRRSASLGGTPPPARQRCLPNKKSGLQRAQPTASDGAAKP